MFIELHIIQNFAPSNLNRDDTGNPKDTEFGGVRRARISSQCLKRAIRSHPLFAKTTQVENGVRTRWISRMFTEQLAASGKRSDEIEKVSQKLAASFSKPDGNHSSVLVYISQKEIDTLARFALANWEDLLSKNDDECKKLIKPALKDFEKRTSAPDIALFGRMLAENPALNMEAAVQVAHAISTHKVGTDIDFFTAVDDLTKSDETGAGMMGIVPFNSACFYRYACLDWNQLLLNLHGETSLAKQTVEGFLRAAIAAVPSGKQTSFAAQNPPDFIFIIVRKDGQCWSLANAFEKPVKASREGGYLDASLRALDMYWKKLETAYGTEGTRLVALAVNGDEPFTHLKTALVKNQDELVTTALAALAEE